MGQYELINDFSYLSCYGGVSFITSIAIFKFIGPALSSRLTSSYKELPSSKKTEWNERIMSNLNAVISIALSGYTLLFDEGMNKDYIWYDTPLARITCSVVMGYMLADVAVMLLWCSIPLREMFGYISHHIVTVWAYYYVSVNGVVCYFSMIRLIAETSTPNMNQRWFFDVCGYARTHIAVVLNGFSMVLTFFVFRIAIMPMFWYRIWSVSGTEATNALGHIQLILYLPCVVLDTLNIVWFFKMCRGFMKAVHALKKSKNDHLA